MRRSFGFGVSFLVLLGVETLASAPAEASGWQRIGPGGGYTTKIVADPSSPLVLYVASVGAGVFKSTNGGATWSSANRGLTDPRIFDLGIDPTHPSTVYAAAESGVFKSIDGGATWGAVTAFLNPNGEALFAFAVDPHQPETLYAGSDLQLWVSHDRGGSWRSSGQTDGISQVLADPSSNNVFALLDATVGLLVSRDHGASWTQIGRLPHQGNQDVEILLAIDPAPPSTLWAGVYIPLGETQPGVPNSLQQTFRSTDAGAHWTKVGPGGFPVAVGTRHVVYAGSLRSHDNGATWQTGSLPPGSPFSYLAVGPRTLFCATSDIGVVTSHDAGQTWEVTNQGLDASDVSAFALNADGSALFASIPVQGLMKSSPPGAPWQPIGQALPADAELQTVGIAPDPTSAPHLFAGWTRLFSPTGGLAESNDGGATWEQIQPSGAVCRMDVGTLQVEPKSPQTLYATGAMQTDCSADGGACANFKSTDGGATWTCLAFEGVNLVIAPSDPQVVYSFFLGFGSKPRIARTTDGGATWSPADVGIPARVNEMRAVAVDSTNAQRVLAAGTDGSVWLSTTGGGSWSLVDHGLPGGPDFVAIDPRTPSTFYATSASFGVYRSLNAGQNWHPFVGGLPPLGFPFGGIGPLIFDPAPTDALYLAVTGAGLFMATP